MDNKARLRIAILRCEVYSNKEIEISKLCKDRRNVAYRLRKARMYRDMACEYRHELAYMHTLLEENV